MKIVFVETEDDEQPFFAESLEGHDVAFVDDLGDVPEDAEIVSVFVQAPVGEEFFRTHPCLKLVATRSSATEHLAKEAAAKHGVVLVHVKDYGAATVAEHTFALILAVARRLRHCLATKNRDRGSTERLRGIELRGKTLGVVGAGRVGRLVIGIGQAFGMDVVAFDSHQDAEFATRARFAYVPMEELLKQSDIITLHVPLTVETRHLLNARSIAMCKPGFILINTARGALVEIDALLAGLHSGHIGGVGLDVLEDEAAFQADASKIIGAQIVRQIHSMTTPGGDPGRREERLHQLQGIMRNRQLLAHENVFFTPHVGFNSIEAIERINMDTVTNIRDFIAGKLRSEAIVGT